MSQITDIIKAFSALVKVVKQNTIAFCMVCFALFMFGMMYMVFHMLDNMQKENYEKTTEMLLRQAEKKDKEHVERYYKNLKRLPEIQLQIQNFANVNDVSHLVILEMHNGDSNINNIPFCKVSTTYEVFSTGNKYIMNDNIVSNKIQNTMLSVYPSMIQYLFDTQSNMSTDNTIAVYFTNTDRCENANYLYNAYNFKAWQYNGMNFAPLENYNIRTYIKTQMFKEQNVRVIPLTSKDYRIDTLLGQTQSSMVVYKALTNTMNQICAIICAFVPNLAYYKTAEEYMQDCMKTVINVQEFANSSSVIKSITESYEFKSEEK